MSFAMRWLWLTLLCFAPAQAQPYGPSPIAPACSVTNTFLPVLSFSGGNTGMSYASSGVYCVSGKLVTVTYAFVVTAIGSASGTAQFTNLPVAPNTTTQSSGPVGYYSSLSGITGMISGITVSGNLTWNTLGGTALTSSAFATANATIIGSITYLTN